MITISQLVQRSDLGLEVLAGGGGGDRIVSWAHTVDLPDPWRWVRRGDLVMTTGAGLPEAPDEQVEWMRRLIDAGTSGLVIAPRPDAPALGEEALHLADEQRFPVVGARFELEFAALARVVIESSLEFQRHRLAKSERLFSAYAESLRAGGPLQSQLDWLGKRFGWDLEIMRQPAEAPSGVPTATAPEEHQLVSIAIPGRTPATLVARPKDPDRVDTLADPLLVHYLAGLLGIELEREAIERDRERLAGEALMRGILDGSIDYATALAALERRGLPRALVAAALRAGGAGPWATADLHHLPAFHESGPPLLDEEGTILMVLPDEEATIGALLDAVGPGSHLGLSAPVNAATGLIEALRQARLALFQAIESGHPRVAYAVTRPASLIPDTVSEASALATRYLGPILDYDASHRTELTATLAAFLEADRNWKQTAERLHIHRQTLVYRLKTVEQLTGLKPTSTVGTASLWLALQAAQAAGILP